MAAWNQREHQWAATPVLPQGTDLSTHGADEIAAVAAALNARPRKTLAWKTPAEALDELLS
jgi:IS30 family transposase